jgi:hypothetical protein
MKNEMRERRLVVVCVCGCSLRERLIGSYIRSCERPGDLPRVIEMLCLSIGVTKVNFM